jgi:hypothetical protein
MILEFKNTETVVLGPRTQKEVDYMTDVGIGGDPIGPYRYLYDLISSGKDSRVSRTSSNDCSIGDVIAVCSTTYIGGDWATTSPYIKTHYRLAYQTY